MKWIELFKIYSLKNITKEKVLFIFTAISILISTSISLIIPQISLENEKYIKRNIEEVNGGDLSVTLRNDLSEDFQNKLSDFRNRGLDVRLSNIKNCYYEKESNNIMGSIVVGDYLLKEDEIILQSILANNLNVKVGDFVEVNTQGTGKYKYKVKEIEAVSSAVDRDAELLGYGKVQLKEELSSIKGRRIINITWDNGENLKDELYKIDNSNIYTTIDDKKKEVDSQLSVQKATLGVLSTVGYILSTLAIISTTIMIILKRKRDIAILRVISIDVKEIKKALVAELSIWILAPIILSGFISYYGSNLILKYSGIIVEGISKEGFLLILKGMLFNGLVFFILINISLTIIKGINGISIIREDSKELKKQSKKIVLITILLLPTILILYSLYLRSIENIGSSLLVILIILIFLMLVSIVVKVLSLMKFRSPVLIYSIKSIKNRFFSFVLVLLSVTLTLWFILIGFSLEGSIKENFKTSMEDILPYNYYAESNDSKALEDVLKNDNNIEGYIKSSSISGKIKNEKFNPMHRSIVISEINKEDYGLNYNIVQGKDLFNGEKGLVISDEIRERNALDIGDTLEIETENGVIKERIKGVYKSGGINSISILKEKVELGEDIGYLIKSKSDKFLDSLSNSNVASMEDMGDRIAANISGFLNIFRILSVVCILGTVLFNINMIYIKCSNEEKDEEILIALGLGKKFIVKVQVVNIILLILFSSILSLGIYSLIVKLFFNIMFKGTGNLSLKIVVLNLIIALVISIISFNFPLRKTFKKKELSLLREDG